MSRINNTDIDNAQDIDIVMPMYNLMEYNDNYSKTSGNLWQYYKDEPNDNIEDSESFKSKVKIIGKTPNNGNIEDVEIIVPLKYLSNFWRTLERPLINCKVSLILTCSRDIAITSSEGEGTFAITETKLYVPVVTLSTQDNAKLLQQLKSGFQRTINWNKQEYGVEHIPKEIKTFINCSLSIVLRPPLRVTTNIFTIQAYDSIKCGYFSIGFIDFMLAGKTLTECTNLFSPNNFKENDDNG